MSQSPKRAAQQQGQNLTQFLAGQLKQRILSGDLKPGNKLPTEQQLAQEFEVSRTVVREAISGLKQSGLLTSRQGSGVFVLEPSQTGETLTFLSNNPRTIASVIESLELRTAVEIGAAELAAQRCSPAQEARIFECYSAFKARVEAREPSEKEDYAFHLAVAEASNNKKFVEFLTLLGRDTIPRSELRKKANLRSDPELELRILKEHRDILDAIAGQDSTEAGQAMRRHLEQGADRYRSLARAAQLS
ncbi:FadR/GntR family transcriptional regulator [Pseudophaeobacter sp.]|uniref:FadR/GntR family transcriptional regulator n=1 Tax=Pseudophaeobacter sp. TaxID=1971739 RepID=UPI0032978BF7